METRKWLWKSGILENKSCKRLEIRQICFFPVLQRIPQQQSQHGRQLDKRRDWKSGALWSAPLSFFVLFICFLFLCFFLYFPFLMFAEMSSGIWWSAEVIFTWHVLCCLDLTQFTSLLSDWLSYVLTYPSLYCFMLPWIDLVYFASLCFVELVNKCLVNIKFF